MFRDNDSNRQGPTIFLPRLQQRVLLPLVRKSEDLLLHFLTTCTQSSTCKLRLLSLSFSKPRVRAPTRKTHIRTRTHTHTHTHTYLGSRLLDSLSVEFGSISQDGGRSIGASTTACSSYYVDMQVCSRKEWGSEAAFVSSKATSYSVVTSMAPPDASIVVLTVVVVMLVAFALARLVESCRSSSSWCLLPIRRSGQKNSCSSRGRHYWTEQRPRAENQISYGSRVTKPRVLQESFTREAPSRGLYGPREHPDLLIRC